MASSYSGRMAGAMAARRDMESDRAFRENRARYDEGVRFRNERERGGLLGVPLAHKDIYVTRGWRATAASRMLENYVSPFDAAVVERLAAAGAVCLGKTNCDEFAMGGSNEHSYFGPVHNPWDRAAISGGSSGGSAAAVAAGLAPLATATDTGGSVRQPASMCGVTGVKPTYGRVSRHGMIAFASSLDQGAAMARSAEDCAVLLGVMAGFDARDSTSAERPDEDFRRELERPLEGLRVGVPAEFFGDGLSPDVRAVVDAGLAKLHELGARLVEVPHRIGGRQVETDRRTQVAQVHHRPRPVLGDVDRHRLTATQRPDILAVEFAAQQIGVGPQLQLRHAPDAVVHRR